MDTVEANETLGFAADARDYDFSAQILKKLGAMKIRLLSNNPEKVRQLENSGIRVVERVPCQPRISKTSRAYLKTKKRKMGHLLEGNLNLKQSASRRRQIERFHSDRRSRPWFRPISAGAKFPSCVRWPRARVDSCVNSQDVPVARDLR